MHTDIKATGMELTDAIRDRIISKMDTLDAKTGRFGEAVQAQVEVGKTSRHHNKGDFFRAEIRMQLPGKLVYASSERDDLYDAFTDAFKEAERQILSYKDKFVDGHHQPRPDKE